MLGKWGERGGEDFFYREGLNGLGALTFFAGNGQVETGHQLLLTSSHDMHIHWPTRFGYCPQGVGKVMWADPIRYAQHSCDQKGCQKGDQCALQCCFGRVTEVVMVTL